MKLKYVKNTLADILHDHPEYRRILLKFFHGLGDAIDFYANCLPRLKMEFRDRDFVVETQLGQEIYFGSTNPGDESDFDLSVFIMFPCAEWDEGPETKAEKCARVELGIRIPEDTPNRYWEITRGREPSPLVGVHFVSTSCDDVSCPESTARLIWEKIEKRGLIPLDTHFRHKGATLIRDVFAWENRTVRDVPATVEKLFGLMWSLGGFAGISSGNFWTALCTLDPRKILYIETEFPVRKLTHIPIKSIKADDPDEAVIEDWLNEIEKG